MGVDDVLEKPRGFLVAAVGVGPVGGVDVGVGAHAQRKEKRADEDAENHGENIHVETAWGCSISRTVLSQWTRSICEFIRPE